MSSKLTSYLYISIGIIALLLSLHLLLQIVTLICGVYFLYAGLRQLHPQSRTFVFMRTMYSRFFGRF